ncbi:hypothetical protein D9615_009838 [Tricholomella constricta]|uniref:Ribonuclease H1 N-terminal domain-containing protein n=1 Tax=Tricholomella constricta TaxID=117010 RepID=A0A8H5GX20_9AGAR|nr:hypothetical protein D9615_009838 [Tricholomella constricta]
MSRKPLQPRPLSIGDREPSREFRDSLALCIASLNTVQVALTTAQAALQCIAPTPTHSPRVSSLEYPLPNTGTDDKGPRATSTPPRSPDETCSGMSDVLTDWESPLSRPSSPAASHKWYAIIIGRNPGVFHGPDGVAANVSGIPGGNPARFDTEQQAREAYQAALEQGLVQRVAVVTTRTVLRN